MNKEGFIEDDLDRLLYYRTLEAGVFLGGLMCPVSILALIKERKNRKKNKVQDKDKEQQISFEEIIVHS